MMRPKTLRTSNIKMLVLDEADEMLKKKIQETNISYISVFTTKYSGMIKLNIIFDSVQNVLWFFFYYYIVLRI